MTNCPTTDSAQPPVLAKTTVTIPLRIRVPATTTIGQPVTFGVPLPPARVHETGTLCLSDADGNRVDASGVATARWPDGSIRWLLVDAILPQLSEGCHDGTLVLSPDATTECRIRSSVHARAVGGRVVIEHSELPIVVKTDQTGIVIELRDGDRQSPSVIPIVANLTLKGGERDTTSIHGFEIEQTGPIRATVATRGEFQRSGLRFTARLSWFSCGILKCDFTLHNPRRARHGDGLWDLGDPGSSFFRDLSLHLAFNDGPTPHVRWKPEADDDLHDWKGVPLQIIQQSSGGKHWNSRNHVNREGNIPCQAPGYRIVGDDEGRDGMRADPMVVADLDKAQVSVVVPEFWQQFPSTLEVSSSGIRAGLFPSEWDDLFELQGGERKTLTAVWQINTSPHREDEPRWSSHPAVIVATPDWNRASGAAMFLPTTGADRRLDDLLDQAILGENSFFAKRETIDEFGWRNYGDVWADHEEAYYDGPRPIISHYNNQFDIVFGAVLQLMRTGAFAWYDVLDPLARHVVDIDIYHTTEDKPAYNGGLFWFTDHYLDAASSTHRTYSMANRPSDGSPYGGGPGSEHNFSTGLLYYYYLTGNRQAAEDVIGLADWVINMDDGSQDMLGVVDDGPTGRASMCGSTEYHGPGRGAANSISVLLDAWLLTQNDRYLRKTDELIRRCIHPCDDIDGRDLLNAEKRWSYTMFLASLVKYLRIKLDGQLTDDMFHYAKQSLLCYADWMFKNERRYLDHPETLEYPTEAWAAQEFRKANVLRMAAMFSSDDAAARWVEKGDALADRAWQDLMSFDTRHFTRAIAVMMIEGTHDAFFRSEPRLPQWYVDSTNRSFGTPTSFAPQRSRVTHNIKTVGGLARSVLRLINPIRWHRWRRARQGARQQYNNYNERNSGNVG